MARTINHALHLRDFILDLLFPTHCLGCKQEGVWLCKKCFRQLEFKANQYCLHCKLPNRFGEFCPKCSKQYALDGVWIAGEYDNAIIASLIKNLKYHFAKDLSLILGNFLSLFLKNLINQGRINKNDLSIGLSADKLYKATICPDILINISSSLIVPVPLHKKRLRWRGFNQAERIANLVAENFNIATSHNLKRVKHKKPQAKLNEAQRKTNLKNCFAWAGPDLQNRRVILIDDVTTTGSTLNECAKTLKQAGAKEVWGLVVAKG